MIMPPTNQRLKPAGARFHDLDDEEMILLNETMSNIKKHVDKNILMAKSAEQVDRLLTFRALMY